MTERVLVSNSNEFFDPNLNGEIFLSAAAAIDVCKRSVRNGLIIARVEGGIFKDGKFMPRFACIWMVWIRLSPNKSQLTTTIKQLSLY